jgi:tRNA(Ile)-lysidine synthase
LASSPKARSSRTRGTRRARDALADGRPDASIRPGTAAASRRRDAFKSSDIIERLAGLLPKFPDARLCVALSGGVDSVALLAALCEQRPAGAALRAVHVNHGLHSNAARWSAHCRALCERLRVPLTTLRVKVERRRGESLEAEARKARYAALAKELQSDEALLTAHHEDDQLETVLLQLLRGAGVAGLAGMPERMPFASGVLLRPLLGTTRVELETWLTARGIGWIEDDTNADERLDRNYLRRQVLPLVRARWPSAATTVSRSARHAAEAKGLLDALARADVESAADGGALSVTRLRALDGPRRRNALRFWIARAGHPLPDAKRLEEISGAMLGARADANPEVRWNRSIARRHSGRLTLGTDERAAPTSGHVSRHRRMGAEVAQHGAEASSNGRTSADVTRSSAGLSWHWRTSPEIALPDAGGHLSLRRDVRGRLDLDALPEALTIRTRRGGERLRPHRTGRTRTLKALLQEAKVPAHERGAIPLLFADDKLVAVANLWLDASVQATAATKKRATIIWHP